MPKYGIFLFFLFFILNSCSNRQSSIQLKMLDGATMGTVYSVKIPPDDFQQSVLSADSLHSMIDSLLSEINLKMSTYIEQSEISQFNRYEGTDWFPVSEDLAFVAQKALDISRLSDGAFDITVGPLVNLWGFGPEERDVLIPDEKEIRARLKLTGYQKIHIRHSPPALKKDVAGLYCDLSAIAKGFGVDRVAEFLEEHGFRNYLVDIGGEIRTGGKNHLGKIWKIGIATPEEKSGIQKVLPLDNTSVATSGDYRNYFDVDTVRYSHTIDPLTGRPVTHKLASVTVVYDSCMMADGLATAIDVMGPEKGLKFAQKLELPVFLIVRDRNGFVEKMTPEFEEILKLNRNGKLK